MIDTLKNFFKNSTLAGAIAMVSGGINAQTPPSAPHPPQKLSVEDAQQLIKRVNKATDNLYVLGIIGQLNPTGILTTESGKIDIGIKKEDCEKAAQNQSVIVDMPTYQMAQKVLIDAGQLTESKAAIQLKTQTGLMQRLDSQAPAIAKACQTFGVQTGPIPEPKP